MNFLDRRFLNFSLSVQAIADEPAANPTVGTQYIVGDNPTGDFASASQNQIARYNGSAWLFFTPKAGDLEVFNLDTSQILQFNGEAWINKLSIGNADSTVTVVKGIVRVFNQISNITDDTFFGNVLIPSEYGDSVWLPAWSYDYGDRLDLNDGDLFLSPANKKIYTYDAASQHFNASDVASGQLFFNSDVHDLALYFAHGLYDEVDAIVSLGSVLPLKPVDRIFDSFVYVSDYLDAVKNAHNTEGYTIAQFNSPAQISEPPLILHTYSGGSWSQSTLPIGTSFAALYYGNTLEPKIYTAIAHQMCDFKGDFSWYVISNNSAFLNKQDNSIYVFNGTAFVKSGGNSQSASSPASNSVFVTEAHSLTAADVNAKSFSLSNSIANGQESNTLLFVSGLAQTVGSDFTASGNSISWNSKGLDAIGLSAGDSFLVQYIKA